MAGAACLENVIELPSPAKPSISSMQNLSSLPNPKSGPERVCAVVVAFNRCDKLRECLTHLQAQTRPLDAILVVNNASTDGTAAMVREEFPDVTVETLPENTGGAGGFHAGMKRAYEEGFDWLWIMDDDVLAAPDALEHMMAQSGEADVLVPLQRDSVGRFYGVTQWKSRSLDVTQSILTGKLPVRGAYGFSFAGPMIARRVMEAVGWPRAEFFIWFDDGEYALRVEAARLRVRAVTNAVLQHDVGGTPQSRKFGGRKILRIVPPPWKLYYGARNTLFVLLRHPLARRRRQRMLLSFLLSQIYGGAQDLLLEADRAQRLQLRLRGLKDGITGNLGKKEFSRKA